eukprot:scaffold11843_cov152-Amphora_coffeaeformis.AAC.6
MQRTCSVFRGDNTLVENHDESPKMKLRTVQAERDWWQFESVVGGWWPFVVGGCFVAAAVCGLLYVHVRHPYPLS